jgi:hypothetical protein
MILDDGWLWIGSFSQFPVAPVSLHGEWVKKVMGYAMVRVNGN